MTEEQWDLNRKEIAELIERVREGLASVRYAAKVLGWTVEDVQIAAWGKVIL